MSAQDEQNDERPPDRPWLTVSLFLSCLTGLVLQVLSFAYLFQGLYNNVPADRAYCMNSTNNTGKLDNETTDEPEVVLNLVGIISVCRAVPFGDMIYYIVGFRLGFGNLLFGFIKLTVWTSYSIYRRSCCPDSEYYLGSSRRLSAT